MFNPEAAELHLWFIWGTVEYTDSVRKEGVREVLAGGVRIVRKVDWGINNWGRKMPDSKA